jgi:hypothetical protein
MQITVRTEAEAERIVADVWLVLERRGLPSPTLTVKPQSPSLTIEFQFEQQTHEALVQEELLSPDRAIHKLNGRGSLHNRRDRQISRYGERQCILRQIAVVINRGEASSSFPPRYPRRSRV